MRISIPLLVLLTLFPPLVSAQSSRPAPRHAQFDAVQAERFLAAGAERLAERKKSYERDLGALRRIRAADEALVDPMQPAASLEKAHEELGKAKGLAADLILADGLVAAYDAIEAARRSPGSADFPRLRTIIRRECEGPARRIVLANAVALEEEILAWLKVQERIAEHLRLLSEIAGESVRASQ